MTTAERPLPQSLPGLARVHFETLDGLRGVAALVVLVYHRRWWLGEGALEHGYLAVDFFFMLSGFVISYAYGARLASGDLGFARFLRLRAERLLPLLALGAVLGAVVASADALSKGWAGGAARALAGLPLAALALPVPWLSLPFEINRPSWSLFYEIAANLGFAIAAGLISLRRLWLFATLAALAFCVLTSVSQLGEIGWQWTTLPAGIVRVAAPFAIGILLHRLWEAGALPRLALPFWILAPILVALLAMPGFGEQLDKVFVTACCLGAFPLIIVAGCQAEPTGLWRRLARTSAELSYPLYILHYPLLDAFNLVGLPGSSLSVLTFAAMVIIGISFVASRAFDLPVRRWLADHRKAARSPSTVRSESVE